MIPHVGIMVALRLVDRDAHVQRSLRWGSVRDMVFDTGDQAAGSDVLISESGRS